MGKNILCFSFSINFHPFIINVIKMTKMNEVYFQISKAYFFRVTCHVILTYDVQKVLLFLKSFKL